MKPELQLRLLTFLREAPPRLQAILRDTSAKAQAIWRDENARRVWTRKLFLLALGAALCLAALPWIFSLSFRATIVGLVALALGIAVFLDHGYFFLVAYAIIMLILAIMGIVISPPRVISIGSFVFAGPVKILPYTTLIVTAALSALKGLEKLDKIRPKRTAAGLRQPAPQPPAQPPAEQSRK